MRECDVMSTFQPETHYAKSGDVHIAYQVTGDGPLDLVFVPGFVSHVEASWQTPNRNELDNTDDAAQSNFCPSLQNSSTPSLQL